MILTNQDLRLRAIEHLDSTKNALILSREENEKSLGLMEKLVESVVYNSPDTIIEQHYAGYLKRKKNIRMLTLLLGELQEFRDEIEAKQDNPLESYPLLYASIVHKTQELKSLARHIG